MQACLTVVSRTGFGRNLSALRVKVIMLTDEVGRGGVGRGGGLGGLGGGSLIEGCNKSQRCAFK